jgi:hypothetical protein
MQWESFGLTELSKPPSEWEFLSSTQMGEWLISNMLISQRFACADVATSRSWVFCHQIQKMCRRTALWMCSHKRCFVHSDSFFLNGKCVSAHIILLYHEKAEYQLSVWRNVSASVTSYSFMAMTAVVIARSRPFIALTEQRKWRVQW